MAQSLVLLERSGNLATLRLSRPAARNAVNLALADQLAEHLDLLEADPGVRAVILCGAGKGFCAGSDVKELAGRSGAEAAQMELRHAEVFERLAQLPCPVVAALHGFALGGGLFLALYCDVRIAAEETVFGLPEAALGWIPPWGLSRLASWVGPAAAQQLVLLRDTFDAARARELRLVDRVVPAESLHDAAREAAERMGRLSRDAWRETRAFFAEYGPDHRAWNERAAAGFARCFETEAAQRAVEAFVSKRRASD
jgi:enoyl-CoA hydratase